MAIRTPGGLQLHALKEVKYFSSKMINSVSLEINCIVVLQHLSFKLFKITTYIILDKEMFRKDLSYIHDNTLYFYIFLPALTYSHLDCTVLTHTVNAVNQQLFFQCL